MVYDVGCVVQAATRVTEPGFKGKRLYEHAKRGEEGRVIGLVSGGKWITVAWERGTATDVHVDDVVPAVTNGCSHVGRPKR